jgi:hypothetical protein
MDQRYAHHDALEFPGGRIVLVTRLVAGQTATVLQLPPSAREEGASAQGGAQTAAAPVVSLSAQRERVDLPIRE